MPQPWISRCYALARWRSGSASVSCLEMVGPQLAAPGELFGHSASDDGCKVTTGARRSHWADSTGTGQPWHGLSDWFQTANVRVNKSGQCGFKLGSFWWMANVQRFYASHDSGPVCLKLSTLPQKRILDSKQISYGTRVLQTNVGPFILIYGGYAQYQITMGWTCQHVHVVLSGMDGYEQC